ncbi:MAG: hypothetical protein SOU19_06795 [Candidatus Caccosoma sp.]|nr:hypothetical protein [Candidatus Caccosoma sp.]
MGGVFKFFLNALKAIFLSPFYLVYFIAFLLLTIFNYLIGELRFIFSGFRYGTRKENKYIVKLEKIKQANGGVK